MKGIDDVDSKSLMTVDCDGNVVDVIASNAEVDIESVVASEAADIDSVITSQTSNRSSRRSLVIAITLKLNSPIVSTVSEPGDGVSL